MEFPTSTQNPESPDTARLAHEFTLLVERNLRGDLPDGVASVSDSELSDAMYKLRAAISWADERHPEVPILLSRAISNAGFTLLKTQQGYELKKLGPFAAQAAQLTESADRFFMDHGLWHDRETGQHLYTEDQHVKALTELEDEAWSELEAAGIPRDGVRTLGEAIRKLAAIAKATGATS